MPMSKTYNY